MKSANTRFETLPGDLLPAALSRFSRSNTQRSGAARGYSRGCARAFMQMRKEKRYREPAATAAEIRQNGSARHYRANASHVKRVTRGKKCVRAI